MKKDVVIFIEYNVSLRVTSNKVNKNENIMGIAEIEKLKQINKLK